jgi:hypothetical protein
VPSVGQIDFQCLEVFCLTDPAVARKGLLKLLIFTRLFSDTNHDSGRVWSIRVVELATRSELVKESSGRPFE